MIPLKLLLPLSPTVDGAGDGVAQIFRSLKNRLSETEQTGADCDKLEMVRC